jgi:energy-coupling factor transporter transmembrane protein EcfT
LVVALAFAGVTLAARTSGVSFKDLRAGWASGFFFAAIVAIPALFFLPIASGWRNASLLVLRSEASLTCWLTLALTTGMGTVFRALRALLVPALLVAILAMTFRYLFLLTEIAQDMLLSRRSRLVARISGAQNRKMLAATAGVLLGKSIQMSDDVFLAMTARGYRGEVHSLNDFELRGLDLLYLIGALALCGALWIIGR